MTARQKSDLSITNMITDRIGQQEVLLPIDNNCYNFWKKQINSSILEILQFFFQDKWM